MKSVRSRLALLAGIVAVGIGLRVVVAALIAPPTGTWATVGSMNEARAGAAAVLLPDGRVLVTGGAGLAGPLATAEFLNTDGTFSAAPSMSFARAYHTATVLSDGRVLVAGGTDASGVASQTAECFDPVANAWTTAGPLMVGRSGSTATLLQDGRVLIAGGAANGQALASLELFDPNSNTFTLAAGSLSSPRENHAAALLPNGQVIIVGGWDGTTADPVPPATTGNPNVLATSDIFDPASAAVSPGPLLAVARMNFTATTQLDGSVAAIGGSDGQNALGSIEVLGPGASSFAPSGVALTTPRQGHLSFLLPHNANILVIGGTSGGTGVASAELYTPWLAAVTPTGAMSVERAGSTGAALSDGTIASQNDGILVIAGGTDAGGNALSSAEAYGFAWVKTDAADYAPGTTVNIAGGGWQPGETVTINLVESPLIDTHGPYTVTADANGNISDSSFTTDVHDLNVLFTLTAVGSASQAETTFTDSQVSNITVASPTAASAAPTGTATFGTITVTSTGNANSCQLNLSITTTGGETGLPVGATANFGTNPITASSSNSYTSTLSVTTSAVAPGTYTFRVKATNGTGCQSGGSSANSNELTLNVYGAPTHVGFVTQPSNTNQGDPITPAPQVAIEDSGNRVVADSSASVSVAIGTNPSAGTLYGVTSVAAVNGVATFNGLAIDNSGNGYTLTGASSGLAGATSSGFNVTQVTSNKLTSVTVGAQTGSLSAGTPGSATYLITVTRSGNGNVSAGLSLTSSLPAGASGSFSPASVSWSGSDSTPKTSTLTITTTSGTPAGTSSFIVQAAYSASDYVIGVGSLDVGAACSATAVTTNPTNQTVLDGNTATFTAAASGTPAPTVQWQVSTNAGATWSDIGGATSTTYSFSATGSQNGNQYRAVFTNNCGGTQTATTTAATLAVQENITVTTATPGGLQVKVDGVAHTAPYTFTDTVGATHTLAVDSPQSGGAGTQYVWTSWSDSGLISHTITVPSTATTYTANFKTQYQVTFAQSGMTGDQTGTLVTVNASPQTTLPYAAYYDANSSLTYGYASPVSAGAGKQYRWDSTGGLSQTLQSNTFTVTGSGTVTATYVAQYELTLAANPAIPGGNSNVSGATSGNFYDSGTSITLTATTPVADGPGKRWRFDSWSGGTTGSANPVTFSLTSAVTVTANYVAQYQITFTASTIPIGGASDTAGTLVAITGPNAYSVSKTAAQLPFTDWFDDGSALGATYGTPVSSSTPGKRYRLNSITGGVAALPSTSYTVSGASATVTGNYVVQWLLTLGVNPNVLALAGAISGGSSGTYYDDGTLLSLGAATPVVSGATGYVFSDWTGDVTSSPNASNPVAVTMNQARSITANYNTYAIAWDQLSAYSGQYSDPTGLIADVSLNGSALPGVVVSFSVGTDNGNGTTNGSGAATESTAYTLTQAPGSYTATATCPAAACGADLTITHSYTINPEDARVAYSGLTYFGIPSTATSGTITLSTTVWDISNAMFGPSGSNDPAYDTYPGDIRNATVTFVDHDNGNTLCGPVPVGLVNLSDKTTGTASCSFTGSTTHDGGLYTVEIVVGGYYRQNESSDDTSVTIAQQAAGSISGGGFLVLTNKASGQLLPAAGLKNNFGFTVQYNKNKTNLQGNMNIIIRSTVGLDGVTPCSTVHTGFATCVYQVKGNQMSSLSVNTTSTGGTATFVGKASVQDVTDPSAPPVSIDGGATLQVSLTDNGSPGTTDTISVQTNAGSNKGGGLWFSSNFQAGKTVQQLLGGGNLSVR